jgi:hypothetical protein
MPIDFFFSEFLFCYRSWNKKVFVDLATPFNWIGIIWLDFFFSYFSDWRFPLKGAECPRVWDGLLCWPPTPANVTSHLACPVYIDGFDVQVSLVLFLSCQIRHCNLLFSLTDGPWTHSIVYRIQPSDLLYIRTVRWQSTISSLSRVE